MPCLALSRDGHCSSDMCRYHPYALSPGTLYPILHGMERKGYLSSRQEQAGRRQRRIYEITPLGQQALADAKLKVREQFGELMEGS